MDARMELTGEKLSDVLEKDTRLFRNKRKRNQRAKIELQEKRFFGAEKKKGS